jgi:hypothetical protein
MTQRRREPDAAMHDGGVNSPFGCPFPMSVERKAGLLHSPVAQRQSSNVEITDPTYLPADAALENLEEARDDILLVVAAKHRRRAFPMMLHRQGQVTRQRRLR